MPYQIDLPNILARTESLLLQVQRAGDIPREVAQLIRFPAPPATETPQGPPEDNHSAPVVVDGELSQSPAIATLSRDVQTDAPVKIDTMQRTCEEVVELCENTKSVF